MTKWLLRCTRCGRTWVLEVSFDLASMGRIYHYCPYCRMNTFHVVVARLGESVEEPQQGEYSSSALAERRETVVSSRAGSDETG